MKPEDRILDNDDINDILTIFNSCQLGEFNLRVKKERAYSIDYVWK